MNEENPTIFNTNIIMNTCIYCY